MSEADQSGKYAEYLEIEEGAIRAVTTEEVLSGIPIQGLDNVREALIAFSMGKTRMSRANVQYEVGRLSESNVGSLRFLLPDPVPTALTREANEERVDGVLNDLMPNLKMFGKASESYNHHRIDAFTTTTVTLSKFPHKLFLLELRGYIGGKQLEDGLAEFLGTPDEERGLYDIKTKVEFVPEGDKFRIDFEDVFQRVATACNRSGLKLAADQANQGTLKERVAQMLPRGKRDRISGSAIVERIMADVGHVSNMGSNEIEIARADNIQVGLNLGVVGDRFEYDDRFKRIPDSEDKFTAEGAVLSGPLLNYDNKKLIPPTVVISVREPFSGWGGYRKPTVDKLTRQKMREVNKIIAEEFTRK